MVTMSKTKASDLVLVVDDDSDVRETLSDVLEDEGYQTLKATNGLEALEMLRRLPEKPKVILLDLMMPIMDGLRFIEEQQKDSALASIPVVVITAAGTLFNRAAVRLPIVHKPLDLSRLISAIEQSS